MKHPVSAILGAKHEAESVPILGAIGYSGLPFALRIIDRMRRFSVNAFALHTLCWTKFALPVHDLAHHDNDHVEAHFPLQDVWKDHLRPRTCARSP